MMTPKGLPCSSHLIILLFPMIEYMVRSFVFFFNSNALTLIWVARILLFYNHEINVYCLPKEYVLRTLVRQWPQHGHECCYLHNNIDQNFNEHGLELILVDFLCIKLNTLQSLLWWCLRTLYEIYKLKLYSLVVVVIQQQLEFSHQQQQLSFTNISYVWDIYCFIYLQIQLCIV